MGSSDQASGHEHFSKGTLLVAAASIALGSIITSVMTIGLGFLASGIVLAAGAVLIGILARGIAGRRAMWLCFGLGALAIIIAALMQLSLMSLG